MATVTNVEMLVIIFVFTWQFGYFCTNRGIEFALPWALPFIGGGGRYSVDLGVLGSHLLRLAA